MSHHTPHQTGTPARCHALHREQASTPHSRVRSTYVRRTLISIYIHLPQQSPCGAMERLNFLQEGSIRQLPWLCAIPRHLSRNGARSCTEEQGAVLPGQVQGRHSWGPGVCMSEERQRAHTAGVHMGEVKRKRNPSVSVGRASILMSEATQRPTAVPSANVLPQWNFTGFNVLLLLKRQQHISIQKLSVEIQHKQLFCIWLQQLCISGKRKSSLMKMCTTDNTIPLHEEKRDTRKWASLALVSNFFHLILKWMPDLYFRIRTLDITKYCSEKLWMPNPWMLLPWKCSRSG